MAPEYQRALFDALMEAGEEFGIGLFGLRALMSLRLEKSFGTWFARVPADLHAARSRARPLRRLCSSRPTSSARPARCAERNGTAASCGCVAFIVDAADADVIGDEPIWHDGAVAAGSRRAATRTIRKASVALGYVPKEIADEADGFEIELLGKRYAARMQPAPLFDANFERLRWMKKPLSIPRGKAAALFIDLQEEHRQDKRYLVDCYEDILASARQCAALRNAAHRLRCRSITWPISWMSHRLHAAFPSGPADGFGLQRQERSADRRLCPEVAPRRRRTADRQVGGQRLWNRPSAGELKAKGIEWLFVAGVWTEACVDATVKDAIRLGFRVLLVKDACGSGWAAMHQTGILNLANRLYGGAVTSTDGACRLIAGETIDAWQSPGPVPLRFTFDNASELYDGL